MLDLTKYGFSPRLVPAYGTGSIGVLVLGEAPGEQEDEQGQPFWPGAPAGSVLERAFRRMGMSRDQFVLANTVPYRPPKNFLEGAKYEHEAVEGCRPLLEQTLERFRPGCVLTLGNIATRAMTGLAGDKLGVGSLTGFILPSRYDVPVVPCFHPSYLRRGKMSHFGVLMRSIRLAITVAREKRQPILPPVDDPPPGYILRPTEEVAVAFQREVQRHATDNIERRYLAYDIETPYSTSEDSAEEAEGAQTIKSIQFSLASGTGIFMPWRAPFLEIARWILGTRLPKLSWNGWRFDDPVIRSNGVTIGGELHDLMWAWHHLQPDLPRGLQFAAAQSGWPWPWKHLDHARPEFYGIVDVDVLHYLVGA